VAEVKDVLQAATRARMIAVSEGLRQQVGVRALIEDALQLAALHWSTGRFGWFAAAASVAHTQGCCSNDILV